MPSDQQKALFDCLCGCGGCTGGCCIPVDHSNEIYEPNGTPKNIPFSIDAPNCAAIDGYTGEMLCGGAIPVVQGDCGPCVSCVSGADFNLSASKWSVLGAICVLDTCNIVLCLMLECSEGTASAEGIEECCSRFRLRVGSSGILTDDDPDAGGSGSAACGSWKIVEPTSCVCSEDPDAMPAIVFPLSIAIACNDLFVGGPCNGLTKCCDTFTACSFVGATVVI